MSAFMQVLISALLFIKFSNVKGAFTKPCSDAMTIARRQTFCRQSAVASLARQLSPESFCADVHDTSVSPVLDDELGAGFTSWREGVRPLLPPTSTIAGIVFDMDGTVTRHCIDFADMRRRIYAIADDEFGGPDRYDRGCVLELAEKLSDEGRIRATEVFNDIEKRAIEDMEFMDGLAELCEYLDARGIRRAVLTRNVMTSVDAMHERLLDWEGVGIFYPALSRDSKCKKGLAIPAKPAPDGILHICSVWGCHPSEVLMVGDSPADDMVAAYQAGCGGRVLLAEGGHVRDNDSGGGGPRDKDEIQAMTPSVTIASLSQLRDLLQIEQ